jgi:hypothetical protein
LEIEQSGRSAACFRQRNRRCGGVPCCCVTRARGIDTCTTRDEDGEEH